MNFATVDAIVNPQLVERFRIKKYPEAIL